MKMLIEPFILLWCLVTVWCVGLNGARINAGCHLQVNSALAPSDRQPITGKIDLIQEDHGGRVTLILNIKGFLTTGDNNKHGFHVHEKGDFSTGCESTGVHFNPYSVTHGPPTGSVTERHVGDLGNIVHDEHGEVFLKMTDYIISFSGNNNITNRALVIHADEDDLGTGGNAGSASHGNSGIRLACCAIRMEDVSTSVAIWPSVYLQIVTLFFSKLLKY